MYDQGQSQGQQQTRNLSGAAVQLLVDLDNEASMRFVDDDYDSQSDEGLYPTNQTQPYNSYACGHVFVSSLLDAMLSSVRVINNKRFFEKFEHVEKRAHYEPMNVK
jgi:hypothetical protein